MTTNRKLLWGGLGLLALVSVCCIGIALGSALTKRDQGLETQVAVLETPTSPPVTIVVIEP